MSETTLTKLPDPSIADRRLRSNLPRGGFGSDPFTDVLRDGARQLIEQAIHAELAALMNSFSGERLEDGRARLVRHGHLPEREVLTGIGPVPVKVPRLRDRGAGEDKITFTPSILPRYLRKAKSVEDLLPWLYLKGVSTGDFTEALEALLGPNAKGPNAKGLSAKTVTRLKADGWKDYEAWQKRDLGTRRFLYIWADGVYFKPRIAEEKQCVLVIVGAEEYGRKELLAMTDGFRESTQSWREVLLDLKRRGLRQDPKLAVGDGALGFWTALREVFATTREQRCWVHKTMNVLNAMPPSKPGQKGIGTTSGRPRQRPRRTRLRLLRRNLRREMGQGGCKAGQGPGSAADLLRLPGGTLETHPDVNSDREHLRHRPAPNETHKGLPQP
jgi:transposase-like protein